MSYIHNCIHKFSPSQEEKGVFEKTTHISIEGKKFNKQIVALTMSQISSFWTAHNLRPFLHSVSKVAELAATLSGDEKTGAEIILKALEAPLYHIAHNAGLEGAVIINKVRESEVGTGYDALNDEYVNMIDAGILDPAKVTRSALQNATSVASTLLTTESVVADIKEDTPAMPAGAAGMGGMM